MGKADIKTWDTFWTSLKEVDIPALPETFNAYRKLFSMLLKEFDTLEIVAEIGAGVGTTSIPIIESKIDSVLLDISPEALKKAKQLYSILEMCDGAHFVVGDALHLPLNSKCVDLVFSQGLIEHFNSSESVRILKEMKRTGKMIMVMVPYRINIGFQLAKIYCKVFKRPWPFGETIERDYTKGILLRELGQAGLNPIFVKKWGRTWAFKHLFIIISGVPSFIQNHFGKKPITAKLGYTSAEVLSVMTFSYDQLIAICNTLMNDDTQTKQKHRRVRQI